MPERLRQAAVNVPADRRAGQPGQQPTETMTELSDLYSERIIALAAAIPPAGHLAAPDATASAHSKLCGSTISVELALKGDRVTDYAQTVRACLLGQSSAAIMARNIVGSTDAELREVAAVMRRMLKEGGPPPTGRWADLAALEPVREVKGRHASTLLAFEAVVRALDKIAEARGAAPAEAAGD
jgi:NifU-like protein involved in Fe-S cluster formation